MIYNYFKLTGNSKKRFRNRKLKQQDSNISITNLAKLNFTIFKKKKSNHYSTQSAIPFKITPSNSVEKEKELITFYAYIQ